MGLFLTHEWRLNSFDVGIRVLGFCNDLVEDGRRRVGAPARFAFGDLDHLQGLRGRPLLPALDANIILINFICIYT